MKNTLKVLGIGVCVFSLTSCVAYEETTIYRPYAYDDSQLYPANYYVRGPNNYYDNQFNQGTSSVSVPDSYHVGAYHSPVSFKDRDKDWVHQQNPQGYTIEVADDEKAAQVAQKLYKAPRSDRRAQVKYQRNGKSYYKGLYGTYDNADAAQKALDALPPELKQGAGVKNWGSVQGTMGE